MLNRAALKAESKHQIKGKIGILFLITLIIGAIAGIGGAVLAVIPFGGIVSAVVITPAFALSMVRIYLGVTKGEYPQVKDAFSGFDNFWPAFKVTFMVGLFTFLWSLLFVIPGIVKSIEYSMAMYILAENPDKPARVCIHESRIITAGHKMELFMLGLSFIGWELLCVITAGIASVWVIPYMQTAMTNAYRYLCPAKPGEEPAEPQAAAIIF